MASVGSAVLNTQGVYTRMANNKAAIELRRNRTMQLLLDGTSYRQIAAALGVSLGTVQNEVAPRKNDA